MKKNIVILSLLIALALATVYFISGRPPAYDPVYKATATLDFANTIAGAATDLTVTVTGCLVGDVVMIGAPDGSMLSNGSYFGWVSASNMVSVRFLNGNLLTALNPSSGSFKIAVIPVR